MQPMPDMRYGLPRNLENAFHLRKGIQVPLDCYWGEYVSVCTKVIVRILTVLAVSGVYAPAQTGFSRGYRGRGITAFH